MRAMKVLHGIAIALGATALTRVADAQNTVPAQRLTIGVLPFIDATGGTAVEAGAAVGRLVQAELIRASRIQGRVVAPEGLQPDALDPSQAASLGRERNIPVMLIGTLLEGKAEESNKGGWLPSIRGQAARVDVRSVKARVVIQGDMISSATAEVLASLRATGEFTDRQFGGALYSTFGSWDSWDAFIDSPMGRALRRAVEALIKQIDARAAALASTTARVDVDRESEVSRRDRPDTESERRRPAATAAAPARDVVAPRAGTSIPLRKGLTIVTAVYRKDLGDYESTKVVTEVTPTQVTFGFAGQEVRLTRTVRRSDLDTARLLRGGFNNDDEVSFPGSTALGTSARVLRELKDKGEARIGLQLGDGGPRFGVVKRSNETSTYSALVNDVRIELPVIRARGKLDGETANLVFLDDLANPLVLQFRFDDRTLDVIRIAYPTDEPKGSRIARALANNERIDIYGIYFDFGSDHIRPESEPVLQEIADVLKRNPDWTIDISGHTDNIGSEQDNLDLSERRAAAVKRALVERYRVRANRLATSGFGESRPKESNATLQGRARNRRVELSRQ